ncbi:MAG TPA: head GIN domain-containing protein [Ferruginibacter sp.]|nr:head GIN domain-containing protein [Ferruginibacter sp.]
MKKFFLAWMVVCLATVAHAQNDVVVDPNASARTVEGSFNVIQVSSGIDLYLSQSDNVAIAVSAANEQYKEGIKTVIENGMLKIFYKGDKSWKRKDRKLRAYVSFKELKKIDASGACDVVVTGSLVADELELDMSGACDFTGMVKTKTLSLNLSGASDVKISGTANMVDIVCSGASDVKGYDLVTDNCNAHVSGASDINVTVNTQLNASASGASNIFFKGTGLIKEISSSGSSKISRKN